MRRSPDEARRLSRSWAKDWKRAALLTSRRRGRSSAVGRLTFMDASMGTKSRATASEASRLKTTASARSPKI